ncbi:DUF5753 domain-containing protein [Nocardiopsis sp. RSe5-2]|uniref:DUF5753 domain-containing protein n=1 Tax=Nocardiopsis endophytica TaxID=3018445 RepID=A0ABT4U5L1_9ACTN|nr:DUF5753 domain-containing protein [Nocardiopsis endophytica]MDA2812237.1 DUF5753 domain-containing protein [Nocardiopsis endophytica]
MHECVGGQLAGEQDLYGLASGDRDKLVALAKRREPGWWQTGAVPEWFTPYLGVETEASELRNYDDALIPGLVQTADYARGFIEVRLGERADESEVEGRVSARMRRQERLSGSDPLMFSAVFNESAIHRVVGGSAVMRDQLRRLVEVSDLPNVDLRMLPFERGAHIASEGSFVVLGFPDVIEGVSSGEAVYIEYATGALFLEREEETAQYRAMFAQVQEAALSPRDTAATIKRVLKDRYEG